MHTPEPEPNRKMPADERREQILAVAQALFARDGYHHVSMDDIADRARISKPVLYRHFESKLDLYLAVIDLRGDALLAVVDEAICSASGGATRGRDMVRAIVSAYIRFVEESGDTFSLLFESDVTHDQDVRARVDRASAGTAERICNGLHGLAGLPAADAELLAATLVGMAQVASAFQYRAHGMSTDQAVDLLTQLAWRGVAGLVKDHPDGADEQPA